MTRSTHSTTTSWRKDRGVTEQNKELARKNLITALILAAIAVASFVLFFIAQSQRS